MTAVNDAPVLSGTDPSLTTIAEDVASAANVGSTVASLLSGHATDVDSTGLGMRITALNDQGGGVWQYKTVAGDWTPMGTLPQTLAATGGTFEAFEDVTPEAEPLPMEPGAPMMLRPMELRVFRARAARRPARKCSSAPATSPH